jgi:hypothetical protein
VNSKANQEVKCKEKVGGGSFSLKKYLICEICVICGWIYPQITQITQIFSEWQSAVGREPKAPNSKP